MNYGDRVIVVEPPVTNAGWDEVKHLVGSTGYVSDADAFRGIGPSPVILVILDNNYRAVFSHDELEVIS